MAVTTTNLGVITAYGDAVAAGYTGTKAEWQALMASYATVGQQAVDAKNAAVAAKDTAVDKATEATTAATTATTKASEASASAQSIAQSASQIQENTDDIAQLKSKFTALTSDGVVPSAEQIISDKGVTDNVPYHYRKTGGDGADRLYDQIVGGTVNFNQLVNKSNYASTTTHNGITFTNNGDGTVTANGTATARANFSLGVISVVSDHVYIFGTPDSNNSERWFGNSTYGIQNNAKYMTKMTTSGTVGWNCMVASGTTLNNYVFKPQFFDLTAMFGIAIADYIYQLEQTTAGAGVAFFKSLFPNDYYEYNAGELVSVSGLSGHKMVGFNQWDEQWELGAYDPSTGEKVTGSTTIRSKNHMPIIGGATYYFKSPAGSRFFFYDGNKSFLSTTTKSANVTFETPSNACFMTFQVAVTTYSNDICINISDPARNEEYEPYEAHSYPLDSDLTLRGIPKLVDGKMCFDGDTYDADGTVTRRYGVVDLGTLTWARDNSSGIFYTSPAISNIKSVSANSIANIKCSQYVTVKAGGSNEETDKSISVGYLYISNGVNVRDSAYTDAITFKAAMSGVMLVYELATPTTEEADPYQHLQQCDPNGTEEYVSTGIVPIGHNSFYPENLRAKVEQLPWNFASLIAPTESAFVATRNYTTGALFIVDNVLYKATSNIANGGTITPNTNCTATTLAEIISALA